MQHLIDINGVVKVFKVLSGLDAKDEKFATFCKSAADTISRIIRPDCDIPAEMPRICYAADISVECGNGGSAAARILYEQALADIGDLLIEKKFTFRRV